MLLKFYLPNTNQNSYPYPGISPLRTAQGFLRFPDVTSLTDPTDYDVELIWGGDGPKKTEEVPTGRALSLLKSLLGDREKGFQVTKTTVGFIRIPVSVPISAA